jgi:5-methyltetrahydrofolate--homocysteine methyltransferase
MVDAGADILLTNTFGANKFRFQLHGLEDRVSELNEAGAAIAREIAEQAGRPVIVAGSMGPHR